MCFVAAKVEKCMMNTKLKSTPLEIKKKRVIFGKSKEYKRNKAVVKKMIKDIIIVLFPMWEKKEKKLIENSIPEVEILERGKKIDV